MYNNKENSRHLAISGNIGSGKSTVSQRLAEHGAVFSHSDDLAKYLLENDNDLLDQLCSYFGTDILNEAGQLQRHILAGVARRRRGRWPRGKDL